MPDQLTFFVTLLAPFLAAIAIGRPAWRQPLSIGLLAAAGFFLVAAALDPETRTLEVTAWYPGLQQHEVTATDFVIGTETATGGRWALLLAGFWGAWGVWALWSDRRRRAAGVANTEVGHPLVAPLVLAWTGVTLWILLQKLAAPAGLIQPAGIERMLLPATLAAAMLVAGRAERLLSLFVLLGVFIYLTRVPVAVAMSMFSDGEWGTAMDVHKVTSFADPLSQQHVKVRPHDAAQSTWLIYLPQLVIMPALFSMSLGGFAFFLFMLRKAPPGKVS